MIQRLRELFIKGSPAGPRSRTYIARRRPVELLATPVAAEQMIDTWEGPRKAFGGDYIMTGIKGEHWPVPGKKFTELYDIVEKIDMTGTLKVRKRIMDLPVYQTYTGLQFKAGGENFQAHVGDFIVAHPDGSYYPCDPNVFFETFEIIRPANADEEPDFPSK